MDQKIEELSVVVSPPSRSVVGEQLAHETRGGEGVGVVAVAPEVVVLEAPDVRAGQALVHRVVQLAARRVLVVEQVATPSDRVLNAAASQVVAHRHLESRGK